MTKADLVGKIIDGMGCTKLEAKDFVESALALIKQTLESGENLKIAGFGSFIVNKKKDRRGRNPQTGEAIIIEARRVISFKPSRILRDAINE
ncbi:MAG: integration host factor subunit alpha [Desulfuromonadales bacterium]|nr:integration host factor subunit alpha [Desulfuromonadales bacterium]